MRKRRWLTQVAPLLLWMTVIFAFSSDFGKADNTREVMRSILRRIAPGFANRLPAATVYRIDWNIRKTGHVSEYTLLGVLAWRALRGDRRRLRAGHFFGPLGLGIAYAASDEWHQSFVPSRGAAAADVFYDSFGLMCGLTLCLLREAIKESARDTDVAG